MDLVELYERVSTLGFPGALFVALVAIVKGWVILPRELEATKLANDSLTRVLSELQRAHEVLLDQVATNLVQVLDAVPRREASKWQA